MTVSPGLRPPMAVVALGAILGITAAWWALALWPLGTGAPDWVARTREVCFGATRTGLPHAGGWILLIGEPIGMLAVLRVVWGDELRTGLARLLRHAGWRLATGAVLVATVVGVGAAVQRVVAMTSAPQAESFALTPELPARGAASAPALDLADQLGGVTRLGDYRGQWVLVTFAFGHCQDICPVIVEQTRRARVDAGAARFPLLVVTLDPWRDTPDRLPGIASAWGLAEGDRVLSGNIADVNVALDAWGIPRARDPDTGDVAHGSTVILVDPAGRIAWRIIGGPPQLREALALAVQAGPAETTAR